MRKANAPAATANMKAAGPMPLTSPTRRCDTIAPTKVEYETDTRRHAEGRPPDAKNQAQCSAKLTSGQKRKVRQRHADDFVDHPHLTRVATNLTEAGKHQHCWKENGNHQIRSVHVSQFELKRCFSIP